MLVQSIGKNSLLLAAFATLTTGIIAGTYLGTRDQIKENIRHAEEKALLEILPAETHDNSMLDDTLSTDDASLLGLREQKDIYIARQNGNAVAVIIPATARDGYTGDIDLIIGIHQDGRIAGVRALSHRETPGLGDAVDHKKSLWIESFNGKSLINPLPEKWAVKKDGGVFDQFTGATITPRAVTKSVYQALKYFEQNQTRLLATRNEDAGHE